MCAPRPQRPTHPWTMRLRSAAWSAKLPLLVAFGSDSAVRWVSVCRLNSRGVGIHLASKPSPWRSEALLVMASCSHARLRLVARTGAVKPTRPPFPRRVAAGCAVAVDTTTTQPCKRRSWGCRGAVFGWLPQCLEASCRATRHRGRACARWRPVKQGLDAVRRRVTSASY